MKYVEKSKELFLDTGTRFPREMIWSIGMVKFAAAKANRELGLLEGQIAELIEKKAIEVAKGLHDDMVIVDVFQTGSGTGLNMNVNELISELCESESGIKVHPNDHVNMSQSSNDVGPTIIRIAAIYTAKRLVLPSLGKIISSLRNLSRRTSNIYKSGRTHLRDALPLTMGQEFSAYMDAFLRHKKLILRNLEFLREIPIGGTAVGTGLNAHPKFGKLVTKILAKETGIELIPAKNRFRATRLITDVLQLSSIYASISNDIYRLCQDIRLMFSGPKTGFNEIDITSQEEVAGSSIMPGKTNPVTVESVLLACAYIIGLNETERIASLLGEFELSMGIPLAGFCIVLQSKLLSQSMQKLSDQVLEKIIPNKELCQKYAESSAALITVISPKIGYDKATEVARKVSKGLTVKEALEELGYSEIEIKKILSLRNLVKPGIPAKNF